MLLLEPDGNAYVARAIEGTIGGTSRAHPKKRKKVCQQHCYAAIMSVVRGVAFVLYRRAMSIVNYKHAYKKKYKKKS